MNKLVLGVLATWTPEKPPSPRPCFTKKRGHPPGPGGPPGRVLDTDEMERERGITIFSKQAEFSLRPGGHPAGYSGACGLLRRGGAGFAGLDCAVLVISGSDGVQAHTRTLWRLLERYEVPVFLFVNKMDLRGRTGGRCWRS